MRIRNPALLSAAAVLSAGLAVLGALPASAQTASPTPSSVSVPALSPQLTALAARNCPATALCGWNDADFSGAEWVYRLDPNEGVPANKWLQADDGDGVNYTTANNAITSFYNHRSNVTDIDNNGSYEGAKSCAFIAPGTLDPNLQGHKWAGGASLNNSISGYRLTMTTKTVTGYCDLYIFDS